MRKNQEQRGKEGRKKKERARGGYTDGRGGLSLLRFTAGGSGTIGIRSRGLMILMDVFEGPCVGRAGFVL